MPDNQPATPSSFAALPDHAVVSISGADATAFAHAQFANDVLNLAEGNWQWNAWLTPKGRVIAVFALVKVSPADLVLIVPDYDPEEFSAALARYVFRRKVAVACRTDLQVAAALTAPATARNARIVHVGERIELDYSGSGGGRTLLVGGGFPAASSELVEAWRSHDLRHGLARLSEGQYEQWTPQQLALDRLQAYSVRKGCYPGQEIVARTHFLGKAKRSLVLLEIRDPAQPGDPVTTERSALGSIVSTSGSLSLAILPIERGQQSLLVGGAPALEVQLLDGLERVSGMS